MSLLATYTPHVFKFNFKARTSRGLMKDKTSWFIRVYDPQQPEVMGIGECGPLPGLSIDARPDYEEVLAGVLEAFNQMEYTSVDDYVEISGKLVPPGFPSIRFGLETAVLDYSNGGKRVIFENSFVQGEPIPINGLIWMGDMDFMMNQINQKVAEGFRCIKLKVGGLDFDRECDTLNYLRKRYFREDITIRLDANGAFKVDEVLFRLDQLAKFNVHSIEQPIKPGQEEIAALCRHSPIPVALDEELIGVESEGAKTMLLEHIRPQYIILKPSLHGGVSGCTEWIRLAEQMDIGWWITSALESSIGLNAVCQFTAQYDIQIPQGLGTGAIYENNIASPLKVEGGMIMYHKDINWDSAAVGLT
jgi:o-succinylbenzoate synthase